MFAEAMGKLVEERKAMHEAKIQTQQNHQSQVNELLPAYIVIELFNHFHLII